MTRYLMLTAAAVLAGTGAAAGTFANVVSLGSGCELDLYTSGKGIFAVEYAAACGDNGGEGTGQGLVRKTPQGKRLDLTYSDNQGVADATSFDLSMPLRSGGTWTEWVEFSGTTSFVINSGTYTVRGTPNKSGAFSARTRALIERLRAQRAS